MRESFENIQLKNIERHESGNLFPWLEENEMIVPKWFFETITSSSHCTYRQQRSQTKRTSIYNEYENALWRPTPWYVQLWNRIWRFLYFLTGPRFVCSLLGILSLSVLIMMALLKFKFCSNQLSFDSIRKVRQISQIFRSSNVQARVNLNF